MKRKILKCRNCKLMTGKCPHVVALDAMFGEEAKQEEKKKCFRELEKKKRVR